MTDAHPTTDAAEAPTPDGVALPSFGAALVTEATKGSGLLWLGVGSAAPRPAWHAWSEGVAYVVHAREDVPSAEQPVPGLGQADAVDVLVRGDRNGRVVTWRASVSHLSPGTPEWDDAVALLAPSRLNENDPPSVPATWAATCGIVRLTPTEELSEQPGRYDPSSHSAPPAPSPATTVTKKPYVLGRRARRRPHL